MADLCMSCKKVVRPRQHAISCDICNRWQHRLCNTGITNQQYTKARKQIEEIYFECCRCSKRKAAQKHKVSKISNGDKRSHGQSGSMNDKIRKDVYDFDSDSEADDDEHDSLDEPHLPDCLNDSFNLSMKIEDHQRKNGDKTHDVKYTVLERGSQRGHPKLVTSDGYSYTVKTLSKQQTTWACSRRSTYLYCPASVRQKGDNFFASDNHIHDGDIEALMNAQRINEVKIMNERHYKKKIISKLLEEETNGRKIV